MARRRKKEEERSYEALESQLLRDEQRGADERALEQEEVLFRMRLQILDTQITVTSAGGWIRRENVSGRSVPKPQPQTFGTKTREEELEDQKLLGDTQFNAERLVNDANAVKQAKKAAPQEFQREQ